MRSLVGVISVLSLFCGFVYAETPHMPKRKAGLWEVGVKTDLSQRPSQSTQCVDEATDAKLQKMMNEGPERSNCSKNEVKPAPDGFTTHSECLMAGSKMVSSGTFKGDFNSQYTGEVVTNFTPPLFGRASSRIEIVAKWAGECPAGMRAGDIRAEGVPTMNMTDAAEMAKGAVKFMDDPEFSKAMRDGFGDPKKLKEMMKGIQAGE